jgi:L-alanine-DL-glutamate epimerase-like enolase superfamily enzyme
LAAHRIAALILHPVRIPLGRTVAWASSSETHADYMILELRSGDVRGVAEGTVKITFAGETLKTLACAFEDIFAPRLTGVDASDGAALAKALSGIREHQLARAMIDAAIWDLRAQAAGKPLWMLLGGKTATVPLSSTVTRATPAEMARAALTAVHGHRIGTLKVKTGQGFECDAEALNAIRAAVGARATIYCDSNRAYEPEEVGPSRRCSPSEASSRRRTRARSRPIGRSPQSRNARARRSWWTVRAAISPRPVSSSKRERKPSP